LLIFTTSKADHWRQQCKQQPAESKLGVNAHKYSEFFVRVFGLMVFFVFSFGAELWKKAQKSG